MGKISFQDLLEIIDSSCWDEESFTFDTEKAFRYLLALGLLNEDRIEITSTDPRPIKISSL